MRLVTRLAVLAMLVLSTLSFAKDRPREINVDREGRYSIDDYILGDDELIGYLGELKETEGVTEVVFRGRRIEDPAVQHECAVIAQQAGVKGWRRSGKQLESLPEP